MHLFGIKTINKVENDYKINHPLLEKYNAVSPNAVQSFTI